MLDSERLEFVTFLAGIAETFDKKLSDAVAAVYWETLRDLPLAAIKDAAKRHIESHERGQFMPKPADLRGIAAPRRTGLSAWAEVEDAMVRHGRYRSVRFADLVTNCVIRDLGGWPVVCQQHMEAPWVQKEFERRYESYAETGRVYDAVLPGIHETDNRSRGYLDAVNEPELIGTSSVTPDRKRLK